MLEQFSVNARSLHRGGALSVRTSLTAAVVLNTSWLILDYVPVLGDELQALKERGAGLKATLRTASTNSNKLPFRNKLSTKRKDANKSNGYATWVELRQTGLVHLLRHGERHAKRKDPRVAKCDVWPRKELQRLNFLPKVPPTVDGENIFATCFIRLAPKSSEGAYGAGKLTRSLTDKMYTLRILHKEDEVTATNNYTKYLPRLATLWQKAISRTASEKGKIFAEKIQQICQTFRLRSKNIFCSRRLHDCLLRCYQFRDSVYQERKTGPVHGDGKVA